MRLLYADSQSPGLGKDKDEEKGSGAKKEFASLKNAADSLKGAVHVLAVAVGATVMAAACMGTTHKFDQDSGNDAADAQEESIEGDADVPDADVPDVNVEADSLDAADEDAAGDGPLDVPSDDAEEETEPPCFETHTPISAAVDPILSKSTSSLTTFASDTGIHDIYADIITNVSMTGYPSVSLGECPLDADAEAFVAAPGSYTFQRDVSLEIGGSTWYATVAELPGTPCEPLSADSEKLITHNSARQAVPKNAEMGGVTTVAAFDIMAVSSTLISYEKNGTVESNGLITVAGSNLVPASTVKTILNAGSWDIEVEARAGDLFESHAYSATLGSASSKQARVYPKRSGDSQMYDVVWDTSEQYWFSRCQEHRDFELVISGDLLCKVADGCGCIGDGFDINIITVSLDKTGVLPHLLGFHQESSPPVRTAAGVNALSDPAMDHPLISIRFARGAGSWDDGVRVTFWVNISAELTSKHRNPDGSYDTDTVLITVPVTDPAAWGSIEPTYETLIPVYGIVCTLDY